MERKREGTDSLSRFRDLSNEQRGHTGPKVDFFNVYLVMGFGFQQKRRRWAFRILHGVCEAMIMVWARRLGCLGEF
jgi:hypothetical protein